MSDERDDIDSASQRPSDRSDDRLRHEKSASATTAEASSSEDPATAWGVPHFAKGFPRDAKLDVLVAAYARGDYATVRVDAPELARSSDDEAVRRAARVLRERIEPDPSSKALFLIAAGLLVFLTAWWIAHDGPEEPTSSAAPTSEGHAH